MKEVDDYRADPRNQIAAFTNDFIEAFWKSVKAEAIGQDKYWEINRALSEAIKKNVTIIGASYRIAREYQQKMKPEQLKDYVQHSIARGFADEIFKSDKVAIQSFPDYQRQETEYRVSIPFIFLKDLIK